MQQISNTINVYNRFIKCSGLKNNIPKTRILIAEGIEKQNILCYTIKRQHSTEQAQNQTLQGDKK